MRRLLRIVQDDRTPLVALGLLIVAVTVALARIGVHNHNVFIDETNAVVFGRDIAGDFASVYTRDIARGPERLMSLITAIVATFTGSATQQVGILHVVNAAAQGLVAVPVWLAARLLGLGRWPAMVPVAIAVTGSFAMYGVTLLNTPLGLLFAMTMVWGMIRSFAAPGWRSDVIVVVSLGLLILARIGWAPIILALVPAALASTWVARPTGEAALATARAFPGRLLHRYPLLFPAALLSVLGILVVGIDTFVGGQQYGGVRVSPHMDLSIVWDNTRILFAHVAIGVAIVPLILAVPVVLRDLVRPADATAAGFAWMVVAMFVVFSYVYYGSMNEDRYIAVMGPPVALAAGVALFRRPAPVWATVISALAVARLVSTTYTWPANGPFDFFITPTTQFFSRVVLGKVSLLVSGDNQRLAVVAVLGVAIAAVALAWAARRRGRAWWLGGVVIAGVLVVQAVTMIYPAKKWVDAVGSPTASTSTFAFLDRAVDFDGLVRPVAVDGTVNPDLLAQVPLLQMYNSSLVGPLFVYRTPPAAGVPIGGPNLMLDWRTGKATPSDSSRSATVQKSGFQAVGLDGTLAPVPDAFSYAQVRRATAEPTVRWIVRGDATPEGYPVAGAPLRVRIFPDADRDACVTGGVLAHPLSTSTEPYRLRTPAGELKGTTSPAVPVPFETRVPAGEPSTLLLRAKGVALEDGTRLGPTIVNLAVAPCPT